MEPNADLLTTGQAAKIAGVSADLVRLWIRHGKLRVNQVAGYRLIDRTDLAALLLDRAARRQKKSRSAA